MRKAILLCGLVLFMCLRASAQENQVAAVFGDKITPTVGNNSTATGLTTVHQAFAFELSYARRLLRLPRASVQVELPFILARRQSDVNSFNLFAAQSYSSFFFTPSIKLQVGRGMPISPWISVGAGLAHFSPSISTLVGTQGSATSTTKAAYQGGAGIDFKLPRVPISLRAQARELYTGTPNIGVSGVNLRNNVMVGGGLVFNF
jgi:opacity protein-like surface antigen